MKGWGRIAVGLRSFDGGDPVFLRCWTNLLVKGLRKSDEGLHPAIQLPHHYAANDLVNYFLKGKCDTLLFVDDDMTFEADPLERLRKDPRTYSYDVCQALYIQGKPPHHPNCIVKDPNSPTKHRIDPKPPANSVVEVGIVGMGFTMIRRTVIEKVLKWKPEGKMLFYWGEDGTSEDAAFCMNAQKQGFTLCTHTGITAGHRVGIVMDWDSEAQHTVLKTRSLKKL